MKPNQALLFKPVITVVLLTMCAATSLAQLDCRECHSDKVDQWATSAHANSQTNVADELRQSNAGLTPGNVTQAEDCIACHSPPAVLVNGGMNEAAALAYFFTTSNGVFTASTVATNGAAWPHVACVSCHNVPTDHPDTMPALGLFNSQTKAYLSVTNTSQLCGQCHGNLLFPDTDHQIYNAWMTSRHANRQADVADELSQNDNGLTPQEVTVDENCIACHAPTAVRANGGMAESKALGYFFTRATNGTFTSGTVSTHEAEWPALACTACHDPHAAGKLSYFNSGTQQYQVMTNSAELCGQCHGNLRFAHTDHLSYNLVAGSGGIGVPDQQDMKGATCTDCHMSSSDVDGSNSKNFHGHTWAISVAEPDGSTTTSCTACHSDQDTQKAMATISAWKSEFQSLDATVQSNVARATAALGATQNTNWLAALHEAQFNLAYAESDESGGFHNHAYLMALLNDANAKALSLPLLTVGMQSTNVIISWGGIGTLQASDSLSGPWQTVTMATNPLVIPPAAQLRQRFYRLGQ